MSGVLATPLTLNEGSYEPLNIRRLLMLDAELQWGIKHPLVQEGATAQYGMVNVYLENKDATHAWVNTVNKVSHVAESVEQFEEFKKFLDGGFIADCKIIFRHAWDLDITMREPLLVVDLGEYKFWAMRRYSTLLVTWTRTKATLNMDEMIKLKQKVELIKLHDKITKTR